MPAWIDIVFYSALAGASIPLGGWLASFSGFRLHWLENELRHFVIALGGGLLLGAVALVLVPEGQAHLKRPEWGILLILLGGFCFFFLERYLGLKRREKPQFMGMLLDYLPEAIALGGLLALGSPEALLLAIFIGLQNLPEGFNAYRELVVQMGNSRWRTLRFMVSLVVIGPVSGLVGYFFLGEAEGIIGGVMLFAAGGILYLLFQDIAPQSRLERHWAPPLGAVMGFCFTLFIQVWLFQP